MLALLDVRREAELTPGSGITFTTPTWSPGPVTCATRSRAPRASADPS